MSAAVKKVNPAQTTTTADSQKLTRTKVTINNKNSMETAWHTNRRQKAKPSSNTDKERPTGNRDVAAVSCSHDEVILLNQDARQLVGISADTSEEEKEECERPTGRPRAAWSDDEQSTQQHQLHVICDNHGYSSSTDAAAAADDDYDSNDTNIKQVLNELQERINESEQQVVEWSELREMVQRNYTQRSCELEQRIKDIEAMLTKCLEKAKSDLETQTEHQIDELNSCIKASKRNTRAMYKIHQKYAAAAGSNDQPVNKLQAIIAKMNRRCNSLTHPSPWHLPPLQAATTTNVQLLKLIEEILGLSSDTALPDSAADDSLPKSQSCPTLPSQLLVVPKLEQVICCRWKKDKRACGITDIALTDNGLLFVIDQHNKTVKVFNLQEGGKLVNTVGRDVLQKPSRVSYSAKHKQIIVADDATHKLRIFNADDCSDLGTFQLPSAVSTLLQYPVGYCLTDNGLMLAVDFDSKSIVKWHKDTQQVNVFETGLECPAYMTVTSTGHVAITDWKASCLKLFDLTTGAESSTFPAAVNSSVPDEQTVLPEPHGVCADEHGLVFVADRRNHAVCLFTSQSFLLSYTDQQHKVGVPFAVSCNSHGQIAIADYVGTVRIYTYWNN
jgi:hypothetical protein